jgi:class 3 adenylate cyclase
MSGQLEQAAEHAAEAAGIASANHDWAEHALASALLMQVTTCRGEFADSETAGALALQMYRRSDYAFVPPLIYPAFAAVRAQRGDVDGAYEALDDWASTGGRGLAPYRLLIMAATQDRDRLADAPPFRPVGGRPVDLFSLPILCAQAEVALAVGDLALLQDAVDPLRGQHEAGVRWCLGWPMLIARLLATAERVLGHSDEAERWCAIAASEASRSGSAAETARVSLERAVLTRSGGDDETAQAMALEAARSFDRLGMLPMHQEALRLVGDRAVHERVVRTVLFTDLVDSTATNVRRGDDAYVELLDQHNAILRRRLRQFDGVEIKHTGDGLSSWFTSATAACECALATRDDLAEHNEVHPEGQLHVRFGLASGAPIPRQGDLFGVSVTLAARLCDQASPGQILVSEDIAAATAGTRLSLRALQPVHLKGFPDAVTVFAVGVQGG